MVCIACLFGHKWNGCTCARCGKIQDKGHTWKAYTCTVCGQTRTLGKVDVEALTDPVALADVAKNDPNATVRSTAVTKIQDQALLADIAKNDTDYAVRLAAVALLQDQMLLTDIAKNEHEKGIGIRLVAAQKTGNTSILNYLAEAAIAAKAKASNNWDDHYAVKTLTDQKLLADVAKNADTATARRFAVEKITDLELIFTIEEDRREILQAKRLCPQCGSGQCKRQIITRQKAQRDLRYSSADSRNLEPIEQSVCLKCNRTFISMNPDDVEEMWSKRDD